MNISSSMRNYGACSFLLVFGAVAVWWSFFQIWLTVPAGGLRLSGAQVGTVFSVNGLMLTAVIVFYGIMQDCLLFRRHLLFISAVCTMLIGPFVTFVYRPLLEHCFLFGVLLGSVEIAAGFVGATALYEAYFARLAIKYGFEYGHARVGGSLGFALGTLAAGVLFTVRPLLIFWAGSFLGMCLLLTQIFWKTEPDPARNMHTGSRSPGVLQTLRSLRAEMAASARDANFWALTAFVVFGWTVYQVFESQMFPGFYVSLFSSHARGQIMFSALIAVQTLIETSLMVPAAAIIRRIGVKTSMVFSALVMTVPLLGSALGADPATVAALKLFHGVFVPFALLSIVKYVSLHFSAALSSTIYLTGFYVAYFLATALFSGPLGYLRDICGYRITFALMAAVILADVLFSVKILKKDGAGAADGK